MDKTTQEYYEAIFETFATPGWQLLKAEFAQRVELYAQTVMTQATDPNEIFFAKGAFAELQLILNLETTAKNNFDQLQEEAEDDGATDGNPLED